jgi:inner membrane protein
MEGARTLTMSTKELDRLEALGRVIERRLTQGQAAAHLSLASAKWNDCAERCVGLLFDTAGLADRSCHVFATFFLLISTFLPSSNLTDTVECSHSRWFTNFTEAKMEDVVGRIKEWVVGSIFLRVLLLGFLILLLQIPILQIDDLISEREQTRQEAVSEVAAMWGGSQTFAGPVLVVPYRHLSGQEQGWVMPEIRNACFLPDQLEIQSSMATEVRRRGIFEVPLFVANLGIAGTFRRPDFSEWEVDEENILWNRAKLVVGVTDPRAIQERVAMEFAGRELVFQPGNGGALFLGAGIHVPIADLNELSQEGYPFSFSLKLNGSDQMMFQPFGEVTEVRMDSDWPHPSFTGVYLPKTNKVTDNGFNAEWSVLHFGRNYPQKWTHTMMSSQSVQGAEFGVQLLSPIGAYRMSRRTVKYEFLFTFLTFAAFFLFEIFSKLKVHSIQYLLIGSALCLFYLLTLSLSEHLGFEIAYVLAAAAVVGLISIYCIQILGRRAWPLAAVLLVLFGFLFMLLSLEDYSLLIGSMGLFAILAVVMFLTRQVDWGRLGNGVKE